MNSSSQAEVFQLHRYWQYLFIGSKFSLSIELTMMKRLIIITIFFITFWGNSYGQIPDSVRAYTKATTNSKPNNLALPIKSADKLIYRYVDASITPAFHRSYTISVTPEKIDISIDSYGNILSKESLLITKSKYQSFAEAMHRLHIKSRKELKSKACTGGTSDELDISIGKNYEVKGYIYHCGGESFGNLAGDVLKAVELFKAIIPNLKKTN